METNQNQEAVTATFKEKLQDARQGGGKLTQEKAGNIAMAAVDKLFTDDGKLIKLNPVQREMLKVMFNPQVKTRKSVIRATLLSVGCTLDLTTEELLTKLLTPATLEKELSTVRAKAPVIDWSQMVEEEDAASADADSTPPDDENSEEEPTPVQPTKAATKPATARK
ncbi:MAG: hypothetical protein INR62_00880 [Rhodospirillales bacterium]|nr:hypothetical protein [Acetobacter sp.]